MKTAEDESLEEANLQANKWNENSHYIEITPSVHVPNDLTTLITNCYHNEKLLKQSIAYTVRTWTFVGTDKHSSKLKKN